MSFKQQILALATLPLVISILVITILVTSQSRDLAQSSIASFEQNILEAKQQGLINYIYLALSSIEHIYNNAGPNDIEAQEEVKKIINQLSYTEDGYFFVYDFEGNNIVHPKQPYRVGKNWIDLEDPDGDKVIKNLIDVAKNGGGYHYYKWEKPSSGEIADKLSYAVALDKWQWMIGTGLYIDDVLLLTKEANAELKESIEKTFILVAFITVPAIIAVFLTGILLNLKERKMADSKLRELMQRIIHTQEEERTRIARELHDGTLQNLVGVRYVLDLAKRRVKDGSQEAYSTIEKGAKNLGDAIKEVRRISHDLRPIMLDDLGLTAALEALTHNFVENTNIKVSLSSVAFKNLLPPEAKTALYRVAQEALNNIERHAKASEVTIDISSNRSGITMVISDNGRGFPKNKKKSTLAARGLGLRNMHERMEHFGGSLTIKSTKNGTQLIAKLPRSVYVKQNREQELA